MPDVDDFGTDLGCLTQRIAAYCKLLTVGERDGGLADMQGHCRAVFDSPVAHERHLLIPAVVPGRLETHRGELFRHIGCCFVVTGLARFATFQFVAGQVLQVGAQRGLVDQVDGNVDTASL
jgi:hypothetical protein